MGLIVNMVKNVVDEANTRFQYGLNFISVAGAIGNGLQKIASPAKNKDLVLASFLWTDIARVAQAIEELEMRKSFSAMLDEESKKSSDPMLARSMLGPLSNNAKGIDYDNVVAYQSGKIDSEALVKAFNLTERFSKEMGISAADVASVTLILTQKLSEAWAQANMVLSSLLKKRSDEIGENLMSATDDTQATAAFLKTTQDLLYDLHMRAWSG